MESKQNKIGDSIKKLIKLIETLRGEKGCPWDKKQTPKSMVLYLIEEAYELLDAIESGNPEDVLDETGDVLFNIFFIASIFQEQGNFDIYKVIERIHEKMVSRHPHVFGDIDLKTSEEVLVNWERLKKIEKKDKQGSMIEE